MRKHPAQLTIAGLCMTAVMTVLPAMTSLAADEDQNKKGHAYGHHDDFTTDTPAMKARMEMRKLWEDHITWTRVFIIAAIAVSVATLALTWIGVGISAVTGMEFAGLIFLFSFVILAFLVVLIRLDVDAVRHQAGDLGGVVGEQPQPLDPEVGEDRGRVAGAGAAVGDPRCDASVRATPRRRSALRQRAANHPC